MQVRNRFFRSLALVSAIALGTAACDDPGDTNVVLPEPDVEITVTPASVTMRPGQTIQLAVNVRNADNRAVTYASSNSAVATVNAGVVTAVAPGVATILVSSVEEPGAQAAVAVTVVGDAAPDPSEASVVIEAITQRDPVSGTVEPIDPSNVRNQIFVRLDVDRGNADSLRVFLTGPSGDQDTICSQSFGTSTTSAVAGAESVDLTAQAQAEFVCTIRTAEILDDNGANFRARFRNAVYTVTAQLYNDGDVVAAASQQGLRFRNTDRVVLTAAVENADGPETNTGRNGEIWAAGSVTVTGTPVMFSESTPLSGTILLCTNTRGCTASREELQANGRFEVVFPETVVFARGGVADIESSNVNVIAGNLLDAAGQRIFVFPVFQPNEFQTVEETTVPGQTGNALSFRLDNQVPNDNYTATVEVLPFTDLFFENNNVRFINDEFVFDVRDPRIQLSNRVLANGSRDQDALDLGVDRVQAEFFAGAINMTDAEIIAGGQLTTGAGNLPETQTDQEVRLVIRLVDALGNDTIVSDMDPNIPGRQNILFGIDRTDPQISFTNSSIDPNGIQSNAVTPDNFVWDVSIIDPTIAAGFPETNAVRARVTRLAPGLTASQACGPTVETYAAGGAVAGQSNLPGALTNRGACVFTGTGFTTGVPTPAADGYYTYEAYTVDLAGNRSETISRTYLADDENPTILNIVLPTAFTPGSAANVLADLQDNIDLWQYSFRTVYPTSYGTDPNPGAIELPYSQFQAIDAPFNGVLETNERVQMQDPFVPTFQIFGQAAPTVASAIGVHALDAAFNSTFRAQTINAQDPAGNPFSQVTSFTISSSRSTINDQPRGNEPTTAGLTAVVTGSAAEFNTPFRTVYFYRMDAVGNVFLIDAVSGGTITDEGGTRFITYRTTFDPIAGGDFQVFAVGVSRNGAEALGTSTTTQVTVTENR